MSSDLLEQMKGSDFNLIGSKPLDFFRWLVWVFGGPRGTQPMAGQQWEPGPPAVL